MKLADDFIYPRVIFLIVGRLRQQLILWIDAVSSLTLSSATSSATKTNFYHIRETNWQRNVEFKIYLLASEWATSASNSRLFRIFLPPERSGTLTDSISLGHDSVLDFGSRPPSDFFLQIQFKLFFDVKNKQNGFDQTSSGMNINQIHAVLFER